MIKRLEAEISGQVIGVFFRAFVHEHATHLGLKGYAKNQGQSVQVVAEGEEAKLQQLLDLIKQGPSGAIVTNVSHQWLPETGKFDQFIILR